MLPTMRNGVVPTAFMPSNRLETLFERAFRDEAPTTQASYATTQAGLPMAMWEDEDRIHVEAELPGLTDGDVDVTIHRGVLIIQGERKPAEGRKYHYDGRAYGRFERIIRLPEAIDAENVEARMKDGVLMVSLPKRPDSKPKKVQVRTE